MPLTRCDRWHDHLLAYLGIYRVPITVWWARISNEGVRRRTDQPPLTDIICSSRLKFFGPTARADPSMDHSRALGAFAKKLESSFWPTPSYMAQDSGV